MALTLEDGTGIANADSYVASATIDTYAAGSPIGQWWLALATQLLKDDCARQAARYLDSVYASPNRLTGRRQYPTQGLAWPRAYCFDRDSVPVNQNYIPPPWVTAQIELALRAAQYGSTLTPDLTRIGGFARREQVGSVSIEFMPGAPAQRQYPYVEQVLAPILQPASVLMRG